MTDSPDNAQECPVCKGAGEHPYQFGPDDWDLKVCEKCGGAGYIVPDEAD